jgi:ABC-type glycerol-3-phosphate transport system substrate-binding protein
MRPLLPYILHPGSAGCVWLVVVWLALSSCGRNAIVTPTPAVPPPPSVTPSPTPARLDFAPADNQLVLWLPPFGAPLDDTRGGAVLAAAFRQFERDHAGVRIDAHVKAEHGPAALRAYLRSAQQVAPAILPDLMLIDTQELWQVAELGLVPALAPDEVRSDGFYAFAPAAVTYRDQVFGIPYAVDIALAAYDPARLLAPPRTWNDVLTGDAWLLFPTGGDTDASLVSLLQYMGAGGELPAESARATPAGLEAFFEFLAAAQQAGLIPPEVVDLATFDAVWRAYLAARPEIVTLVIAGFRQTAEAGGEVALAPVPTRNGERATVAATWAFAVLTPEPERRRLALALVDALLAVEVQGNWSRQAQRLPSRPEALTVWPAGNGQTAFLSEQLTAAVALPNGHAFADFVSDLQTAQSELLRGDLSVDAAVQAVATRP